MESTAPNYVTTKPSFSCPASPHVPWHWGLVYKECPLDSSQRDMGACQRCHLNDGVQQFKPRPKSKPKRKKRTPTPKIGKTYRSE